MRKLVNKTTLNTNSYPLNDSHEFVCMRIRDQLVKEGYQVEIRSTLSFNTIWVKNHAEHKPVFDDLIKGHEFDIIARKKIDNNLSSNIIIEVDGKNLHDKKRQKLRDSVAEILAIIAVPDVFFLRVPKEEFLKLNRDMTLSELKGKYSKEIDIRHLIPLYFHEKSIK